MGLTHPDDTETLVSAAQRNVMLHRPSTGSKSPVGPTTAAAATAAPGGGGGGGGIRGGVLRRQSVDRDSIPPPPTPVGGGMYETQRPATGVAPPPPSAHSVAPSPPSPGTHVGTSGGGANASMTSSADLDALIEEGAGLLDPSVQPTGGGGGAVGGGGSSSAVVGGSGSGSSNGAHVANALSTMDTSMASSVDLDALMAEGADLVLAGGAQEEAGGGLELDSPSSVKDGPVKEMKHSANNAKADAQAQGSHASTACQASGAGAGALTGCRLVRARKITLRLLDTYGDRDFLGLTGIEVLEGHTAVREGPRN